MKILLMVSFMLASCSTSQYVKVEGIAENGLHRVEDKKMDVVCYVYQDSDGNALSCLRTK